MKMQGRDIEYGFELGPVKIETCFSDEKKGWVVLLLKTLELSRAVGAGLNE